MDPKPMLVRATIHLPDGIQPGDHFWVDANAPYVQTCLGAFFLVEVPVGDLTDNESEEQSDG